MKLEHPLTSYTKINSTCIKDLSIRPNTIKVLEENIGRILFDINHSKIFLTHFLMKIKTKINKWHINKHKSFCTANKTINKTKRHPQNGENI